MKKVGVYGCSGRMGQEVILALKNHPKLELGCAISSKNIKDLESAEANSCDVWVDFSLPEAFNQIFTWTEKKKKPLVSGTTGLTKDQFDKINSSAGTRPILWSSNMSRGISMFKKLIRELGNLEGFDFQIEEFHHKMKKDKPSGTAISLQKELVTTLGKKHEVPEPVAIRGGGIFGIHRLYMMSPEETLTIEHQALNRSVFAKGSLFAAEKLLELKPGVYTLEDL
ncbi:MAG: dihydrodipicolinate reductase C-terminal domain-containing protein [Bdellovibrionota bacterium]